MRTNKNLIIAIARLSSAIHYLTWAEDTESLKDREHWKREAKFMIDIATEWIEKETKK